MLPDSLGTTGSLLSDICRRMQIVAVPEGMSKGGKGPLLACNNLDLDILWGRLNTVEELAKSMRETIRVEVHGCVERGLLITLFGIRGFVPISHVKKEPGQEWLAKSDLEVCDHLVSSHDLRRHRAPLHKWFGWLLDTPAPRLRLPITAYHLCFNQSLQQSAH